MNQEARNLPPDRFAKPKRPVYVYPEAQAPSERQAVALESIAESLRIISRWRS